ncbi:MAG: 2-polyprenylphenol 6-hydroxylase [Rhodospirillales bacterium]|nr:2-polyprenylphenol 6-hydroxylase [Rhodospirillales bacterium]
MVRAARNLLRLLTIARVLARYDALFLMERISVARMVAGFLRFAARPRPGLGRPGQRLAAALQELGPTFIKFGQALSTRADLVGDEVAADLSELQDRLAPFPAHEVRHTLKAEFGRPVEDLFESFEDAPVAAASIAQVHFARTTDGREVAVKVLRPAIEDAFARDIDLLYWLAELVEMAQPALRRLRPVESVRAFEDSVRMEMDLRFEAAAAAEMSDNFAGDPTFRVPAVDWQRTSRRVLTLERVQGISIDEREALLAAGLELDRILEKAADAFFNQVFRDGFFHADMHPGNLFVDEHGNLIAVDFGITGRVDRKTRQYLGEMLLGFLTGNYRRVAEVHFEAGYVPADKSVDAFTQACRSIGEPIMGRPLHEISVARLLGQLFQVTETFAMQTQPQLLLLQKSMLVAEGVGRRLDPNVNMWQLARPLIEQWMRENLGPEARVRNAVSTLGETLERLPRVLAESEKALTWIAEGGLRLHPDSVKHLAAEQRRPGLATILPWIITAVLLAALLLR